MRGDQEQARKMGVVLRNDLLGNRRHLADRRIAVVDAGRRLDAEARVQQGSFALAAAVAAIAGDDGKSAPQHRFCLHEGATDAVALSCDEEQAASTAKPVAARPRTASVTAVARFSAGLVCRAQVIAW
jgi:hypothetical protein